jgi:hypothetical protein
MRVSVCVPYESWTERPINAAVEAAKARCAAENLNVVRVLAFSEFFVKKPETVDHMARVDVEVGHRDGPRVGDTRPSVEHQPHGDAVAVGGPA